MNRVLGSVLLLDVGPQGVQRSTPTEPAKYDPDHSRLARQSCRARSGNSCRSRRDETPFRRLTSRDSATVGGS